MKTTPLNSSSQPANAALPASTGNTGRLHGLLDYRERLKLLWKTSTHPLDVLWAAEEIERYQPEIDALLAKEVA